MGSTWKRHLKGVSTLIAPLIAFAVAVYSLIYYGRTSDLAFLGLLLLLYLALMFSKVTYEPNRIRQIDMSEIPEEIREIITTTTNKGHLINMKLIQAFRNDRKMSQTDLHKEIMRQGIELTLPPAREYIIGLEKAGIVSAPQKQYAWEYRLTEKGQWCRALISQIFPERYALYVLRNELELRRIPKQPQS